MTLRRPSAARLLDVAFFAGLLAYALFAIDPRLLYHWQAPAFYTTRLFLVERLAYPGGLADYLYRLLAQTYVSQWGGALVLTAQAAAVVALTRLACRSHRLIGFVPAIAIVWAASAYYDRTPLLVALLIGVGAAVPVARARSTAWPWIAMAAPVYYAGGMALVFFAAVCVGALLARRRFAGAAAFLAAAALIPIAVERSRLVYVPESARAWFADADLVRSAVWCSLYVFYAAAAYYCGRAPERRRSPRWMSFAAPAAVLAGFAAVAVLSYRSNARDRRLAAIDYHTDRGNWSKVLDAAGGLATADFNSLTRYEINLALHESGRMGNEMFRFPQAGSTMPPLRADAFVPYMLRVTDLLLRLGRADDAEHFGHEAMVVDESDPRILRLLADVYIAKGQTDAAKKLLRVLLSEAGAASWARGRLDELDRGASFTGLRRSVLRADDFIPVWQNPDKPDADVNRLLLDQLEQDPANRMAFEFLMGNYLIARDLPSVRALMPRIRQMSGSEYEHPDGRRRTPRHYQEAMAMFADGSGQRVEIDGLEVEPETLNRMAVFKRLIAQSPGRDAAMQAAWSRFRNSYFFYFVFGPGDYR